jgi:hypothetical protein
VEGKEFLDSIRLLYKLKGWFKWLKWKIAIHCIHGIIK